MYIALGGPVKAFFFIKTAKVIDHNTNLFPNKNGQLVELRFFSMKSKTTSGIPVKTGGRPSLVFFFFLPFIRSAIARVPNKRDRLKNNPALNNSSLFNLQKCSISLKKKSKDDLPERL